MLRKGEGCRQRKFVVALVKKVCIIKENKGTESVGADALVFTERSVPLSDIKIGLYKKEELSKMKKNHLVFSKRMLLLVASLICMFTLVSGTAFVQAASLKTTAKKQIMKTRKTQYDAIKKYAKTTNYKISKDKKTGTLVKEGKNAYSQKWTMTLKQKEINCAFSIGVVNTYSKETAKVATIIRVDVSYDKNKIGNTRNLKTVSSLKKLMKKCSTLSGFKALAKSAQKTVGDEFSANWQKYCRPCRRTFYSMRDYLGHLFISEHWGYVFAGR